jgi:hypothetical protein
MQASEREALKRYLIHSLDNLPKTELTQCTMLATWLVEMYLDKLIEVDDRSLDEQTNLKREFLHFLQAPAPPTAPAPLPRFVGVCSRPIPYPSTLRCASARIRGSLGASARSCRTT